MHLNLAFHTATCAVGPGLAALWQALVEQRTGLRPNDFETCALNTWIGRVPGLEATSLPSSLESLESRNNRLAWLGLQQDDFLSKLESVKDTIGAHRVGVIIGTSTSSIGRTEQAYRHLEPEGTFAPEFRQPRVHNMHATALFLCEAAGLSGPSITISTACSSSAKVFATAHRWIRQGLVDAALVGGVDSLCLNTLYGFNSLQLISEEVCRPFDRRRNGINLGEAAAYALVAGPGVLPESGIRLLGYGESSDAHHMSHPHPQGKGAILAMERAMNSAGLAAAGVDYVNLHGTGTRANDEIESLALDVLLGSGSKSNGRRRVPASSTKGWTGHTLGAAGMLEAVITIEAIKHQVVPGTLNCDEPDPDLHHPILTETRPHPVRKALSSSFGFGGSNVTLAFGLADD